MLWIDRRTDDGRPRLFANDCVLDTTRPMRGRVATCREVTIGSDRVIRRKGRDVTSGTVERDHLTALLTAWRAALLACPSCLRAACLAMSRARPLA